MANQVIQNPCTKDCPNRCALCGHTCEKWQEYEEKRNAEYARRKKESAMKSAEYGYSAALRKKINRRCR